MDALVLVCPTVQAIGYNVTAAISCLTQPVACSGGRSVMSRPSFMPVPRSCTRAFSTAALRVPFPLKVLFDRAH